MRETETVTEKKAIGREREKHKMRLTGKLL